MSAVELKRVVTPMIVGFLGLFSSVALLEDDTQNYIFSVALLEDEMRANPLWTYL